MSLFIVCIHNSKLNFLFYLFLRIRTVAKPIKLQEVNTMISPSSPNGSVFKTSPGKSWLMRDYESRLNVLRNAVQKTGQTLETPSKPINHGTPRVAMKAAMMDLTDVSVLIIESG